MYISNKRAEAVTRNLAWKAFANNIKHDEKES